MSLYSITFDIKCISSHIFSELFVLVFTFQVLFFSESLVPTVRKALCDPLEEVREAAAKTFEQLHSTIGHQALEDILPYLLEQLVTTFITGKSIP